MLYLASPYFHTNSRIRQLRFWLACEAAAHFMARGEVVFSPIAHSHCIAPTLSEAQRHSHDFWMKQDLPFLLRADFMFILELPGHEVSKGVKEEIAFARKHKISFESIDPEEIFGNMHSDLVELRRFAAKE